MSSLVGRPAPDFVAPAVMGDDAIDEAFDSTRLRGRYVVLFFYPFDFSFVCPTEIVAFDERLDEFAKRECEVLGVSVDSHFTHLAYKRQPRDGGGIGPVRFPLASDVSREIGERYGVLFDGAALRATFILDREGIVRHASVNDLALGRNVDEVLRILDALRYTEKYGKLCPAGWKEGDEGIAPKLPGKGKRLVDLDE